MKKAQLDARDLTLLALVQRNNQMPARLMAEKAGLSESAALRRLRRLRNDGIIAADVSIVQPSALGLPLTVIVLVSLAREGAAVVDSFATRLGAQPEVRQCWYVTGDADWVVVLRLASMESYESFTRKVFLSDPNVLTFRTLVAMREAVGEADARPLKAVTA
jgi:Lrp/AsnC family transcriptional regulator, leucine-responsive regulatory protein